MIKKGSFFGTAALALSCVGAIGLSQRADAQVLGTAANFAVLGATTVTNTGATTITGDLGLDPGKLAAITGGPSVTGTVFAADPTALGAKNDAITAYNTLAGLPSTATLSGDLGGLTETPGVYTFGSGEPSAQLTGTLTLNFENLNNQHIVFQIGSTLTTAPGSSVILENVGTNDGVFFQVGSSATLGTTTTFVGNILALTMVGLDTGATICGRAIALHAAVTMDTNTISNNCTGASGGAGGGVNDQGSAGFSGGNIAKAPEIDPASAASGLTLLLGSLLVLRGRLRVQPSRNSLA
jgi:Ice-binding-like